MIAIRRTPVSFERREEKRRFLNSAILLPYQVVKSSRRLVLRILRMEPAVRRPQAGS